MAPALFLSACIMAFCVFALAFPNSFPDLDETDEIIDDTRDVDDETSQTGDHQERQIRASDPSNRTGSITDRVILDNTLVIELKHYTEVQRNTESIGSTVFYKLKDLLNKTEIEFKAGNVTKKVVDDVKMRLKEATCSALDDFDTYIESFLFEDWIERMVDGIIPREGPRKEDKESEGIYAEQAKLFQRSRDQIACTIEKAAKKDKTRKEEAKRARHIADAAMLFAVEREKYANKAQVAVVGGTSTAAPAKS